MNPTNEIAELTGLAPPPLIDAEFSDDKPKHRTTSLDRLLSDGKESAQKINAGTNILDILGQYDPQNKRIRVFSQLVEEAAKLSAVSADVLSRVVALHEYAHYVTHLGKDSKGNIWNEYLYSSIADKEKFAQVYTYFFLTEKNDKEGLEAFLKLNEMQPSVYKLWEGCRNTPIAQVNDLLIEARCRDSFVFQLAITESGFGLMMASSGGVWLEHTGEVYHASAHEFDPDPAKGRSMGIALSRPEMEQFQECIERITDVNRLASPSGPGIFMDGSSKTFYIKCPSGEATFVASNGDWGKTTPEFDWLLNKLERLRK